MKPSLDWRSFDKTRIKRRWWRWKIFALELSVSLFVAPHWGKILIPQPITTAQNVQWNMQNLLFIRLEFIWIIFVLSNANPKKKFLLEEHTTLLYKTANTHHWTIFDKMDGVSRFDISRLSFSFKKVRLLSSMATYHLRCCHFRQTKRTKLKKKLFTKGSCIAIFHFVLISFCCCKSKSYHGRFRLLSKITKC